MEQKKSYICKKNLHTIFERKYLSDKFMNYYKCFIDSTYYVMYLHKIQYLLDRFATYISDITVRYLLTYVTYVHIAL